MNRDGLTGIGPSPDMNWLVSLQDGMAAEDIGQPNLRACHANSQQGCNDRACTDKPPFKQHLLKLPPLQWKPQLVAEAGLLPSLCKVSKRWPNGSIGMAVQTERTNRQRGDPRGGDWERAGASD